MVNNNASLKLLITITLKPFALIYNLNLKLQFIVQKNLKNYFGFIFTKPKIYTLVRFYSVLEIFENLYHQMMQKYKNKE